MVLGTINTNCEAESLFQSNCCLGLPSFIVQTSVSHHECLDFSRFLHWRYIVWWQVPFLLFGLSTHFINLYERKGKENQFEWRNWFTIAQRSARSLWSVFTAREGVWGRERQDSSFQDLETSPLHKTDQIKRQCKKHCYQKANSHGFVTVYLDYSTPENRLK